MAGICIPFTALAKAGTSRLSEITEPRAHRTHCSWDGSSSKTDLDKESSDLYCRSLIMTRSKTNAYHEDVQLLASQLLLGIVENLLLEDGGERRKEHGCHIDSRVHGADLLHHNTISSVP